ncbi:MAG: L-histidine N(alpha)-methyltransferase [Cellvibrionaceae bacterium]
MQQAAKLGSPSKANSQSRGDIFFRDVIAGLSAANKRLHPKYFYDQQGSEFFDQICTLDEYYPFQAELELLPEVADELMPTLTQDYDLIEFGAGSLRKVKPLLDCIRGIQSFTPIDISGEHLRTACRQLQDEYPDLRVQPVVADFSKPVELAVSHNKRLGFFPGSTIGNFSPGEARDFLSNAGTTLGNNNYLLIGVDTKKSPHLLHTAYNDRQGVTAQFNLNILERINRELDADIAVENFEHYAFYNAAQGRIEMHLISLEDQTASIQGIEVTFREGESVHTESSYKYTPAEFSQLAKSAGWRVERHWLARDDLFATYLLRYGD